MPDKKVLLTVPMTWAGANYEAGLVEMPEDAAAYVEKRGFGTIRGEAGEQNHDVLPEDFPGYDVLGAVEGMNLEKVAAMTDEDLLAIKGIGAKTLELIRAYAK